MKFPFHIWVRCCLALLGTALLLDPGTSAVAQGSSRQSGLDVHLRIETDRATYRAGDSITVRLALRNVSAGPVRFVSDPPVVQARLLVHDAEGRLVEPELPRPIQRSSGRPITLKAGESMTLRWQDSEWLNLRDWGYDLRTPGRYTITGLAGVVGPELAPEYTTVRSNKATFTIRP